jgi:hypothetical protein
VAWRCGLALALAAPFVVMAMRVLASAHGRSVRAVLIALAGLAIAMGLLSGFAVRPLAAEDLAASRVLDRVELDERYRFFSSGAEGTAGTLPFHAYRGPSENIDGSIVAYVPSGFHPDPDPVDLGVVHARTVASWSGPSPQFLSGSCTITLSRYRDPLPSERHEVLVHTTCNLPQ